MFEPAPLLRAERIVGDDSQADGVGPLLDDLETLDAREFFHEVREEFAGDAAAVGRVEDVEAPAGYFLQHRQAATAGTDRVCARSDSAVAVRVSDERHPVVVKIT